MQIPAQQNMQILFCVHTHAPFLFFFLTKCLLGAHRPQGTLGCGTSRLCFTRICPAWCWAQSKRPLEGLLLPHLPTPTPPSAGASANLGTPGGEEAGSAGHPVSSTCVWGSKLGPGAGGVSLNPRISGASNQPWVGTGSPCEGKTRAGLLSSPPWVGELSSQAELRSLRCWGLVLSITGLQACRA